MMYPHKSFEDQLAHLSIMMELSPAETAALVIIIQIGAKINESTEIKLVLDAMDSEGMRSFLKDKCKELLA